MSLRPLLLSAAVLATASAVLLAPAAQAATPGSVQLTGNQLRSALVTGSSLGGGYTIEDKFSTGGRVVHEPVVNRPAAMSCGHFGYLYDTPGYGETALASTTLQNPAKARFYTPTIYQFPSAHVASALFAAEKTKFTRCRSYTVPASKGIPAARVTQTLTATRVGGRKAFLVTQTNTYSGQSFHLRIKILVTLDGADLFMLSAAGAVPAHPSPATLTRSMIQRVSALR